MLAVGAGYFFFKNENVFLLIVFRLVPYGSIMPLKKPKDESASK